MKYGISMATIEATMTVVPVWLHHVEEWHKIEKKMVIFNKVTFNLNVNI